MKSPENQLLLSSGKIITFNPEQLDGLNKIKSWLRNGQTFFTLAGSAGSGKSTMVKKILENYRGGVVVTAPTHKAVKVISNITKKEGNTLHSLLGLRPDVDLITFDPNRPQFNPIAIPKINDFNFVIVDEASMINKELFNLINEKAKNSSIKILFIGDSAQLPPVNEDISIVFIENKIEKHILFKIERQKDGNPILITCDNIRNNLNIIDGGYVRETNINNIGDGIIFTINKNEFRNLCIKKFTSEEYKKDIDYCKGLAWRNQTVMESNKIIRNILFGEKSDIIEINDVLTGYRTITTENQNTIIIQNSGDYQIIEKFNIEENSYGIKGFRVKLKENLLNGLNKFQDIFIIDIKDHQNLHLYGDMHDYFRDMGKSNKKMWKKYYEFRRNNILMCDINKYSNGQLRNNSDIIVKDIDYGYFLTVHKSQGSTYKHVMVIESDLNLNRDVVEKNKLKYVAFSRPEKTCTVLTTKIDNYQ
jgi:hypothetical protein